MKDNFYVLHSWVWSRPGGPLWPSRCSWSRAWRRRSLCPRPPTGRGSRTQWPSSRRVPCSSLPAPQRCRTHQWPKVIFVKYFFIERVYVDISWINSYHFDSGWVVTNGDIGEDVWHAAARLPHEEGLELAELAVVVTPLPGVQPALGLVRHLEHLIGHLNIM